MIDYYIPQLYDVLSLKKTFNSKHRTKLKAESQRYRNTENLPAVLAVKFV